VVTIRDDHIHFTWSGDDDLLNCEFKTEVVDNLAVAETDSVTDFDELDEAARSVGDQILQSTQLILGLGP
jgi:hypothetical protein